MIYVLLICLPLNSYFRFGSDMRLVRILYELYEIRFTDISSHYAILKAFIETQTARRKLFV